jgi:tRNA(Ile)-lysidine synthase
MYSHWVPKGPLTIAFSGGSDSVFAAEHFLGQRRKVTLLHINHGTPASGEMEHFVRNWCCGKDVDLIVEKIDPVVPKGLSKEEHWRNERLQVFHSVDGLVVTGHHLDDQVENYLFTAIHGNPRLMPSSNGNVIRPFLFMTKEWMQSQIKSKWFSDPSNEDTSFMRNQIRLNIVPEVRKVNPGINNTVKKMMIKAGYGAHNDVQNI